MNSASHSLTPSLREDLRISAILAIASAIATAALFPYLLEIMPELRTKVHIAIPLLAFLQALQAGVLLGLLSLIGLRLSHRVDLHVPWLRAWITQQALPKFPWILAISSGIACAIAVIVLSQLTDSYLPPLLHAKTDIVATSSALNGFLASFYGGICEEIQLRLFLMTLFVFLLAKFNPGLISNGIFWLAILLSAILFGVGHLPAAAQIWPMDAVVITRTILLNALAGVVFGYLYWKRGLEVAMVSHFSADIVLHVIARFL